MPRHFAHTHLHSLKPVLMQQANLPQFFKTLKLLFYFLLAGQILFGGVVWWMLQNQLEKKHFFSNYGFLAAIILGWMTVSAFVLYRQRLRRGVQLPSLPMKLSHYRTSSIFRWAMLEMGNLAVIIIAFMELNSQLMLLFLVGMAVFLLTIPSEEVFEREYKD